jgi:hypothetical protein
MRSHARRVVNNAYRSRTARPTPPYNDKISAEFIARQQARIDAEKPENFELTPISGDAW